MYNPVSTYRIQFHKGFTFNDLRRIVSYLAGLGIGALYASPVFSAVPGSEHGYDSTDPHSINPEIGTEEALRVCCDQLKANGIGWLQDIVPNHMAYHPDNAWLMDVLEQGRGSEYESFFDISVDLDTEPVMAPFLGAPLESVVAHNELKLIRKGTKCFLQYFDQQYPVKPASNLSVFSGTGSAILNDWAASVFSDTAGQDRDLYWERLAVLLQDPAVAAIADDHIRKVSENPAAMMELAGSQHYRLCYWRQTDRQINYRRFFTVSGLICLNMQHTKVFDQYHQQIVALTADGVFDGVRIDHIDGLHDPAGYLLQLRARTGAHSYIAVEKILELQENLPRHWPVQGATGYDFMAMVNQLFINRKAERSFTRFYRKLTGDTGWVQRQLREKKSEVLYRQMAGELENLHQQFLASGLIPAETEPAVIAGLKEAIADLLIYCPVYRFYPDAVPLDRDRTTELLTVLERIRHDKPGLAEPLGLLERLWVQGYDTEASNECALWLYRRCMQFSGPLMAKGKEDTLMYTYNLFLGHNEVGDSVKAFGISAGAFHAQMKERAVQWPLTMNTTSTHDTKRGEDARARLQVLTDLTGEWLSLAGEWLDRNGDEAIPDKNERYLLLQTLVAVYPMPGMPDDIFRNRLRQYVKKALREAGQHTEWREPAEAYEAAACAYMDRLLDPPVPVRERWRGFQKKIADFGIINSLAQLILKCTCPGIPDIYQGTELWDLSLVDPDNRRPVDYDERIRILEALGQDNRGAGSRMKALWQNRYDGSLKLWMTRLLLHERKKAPAVFSEGRYIPLTITGRYKEHVLAFARHYGSQWYIVVTGLHIASLCQRQQQAVTELDWGNTGIVLPPEIPSEYLSLWTDTAGKHDGRLRIQDVFGSLPMSVLKLEGRYHRRQAGVLLPVFSLPSPYGMGDFGNVTYRFIDFLARSKQRIWQILPLNPVDAGANYSPYSSISAMAGNTLLISPDQLVQDGLLRNEDTEAYRLPDTDRVEYDKAVPLKQALLELAYENYQKGGMRFRMLRQAFEDYCRSEADWLDDFALFSALKEHFNSPWTGWPAGYKNRDTGVLQQYSAQYAGTLTKIRWMQFIFERQWEQIRAYCRASSVGLLGDIPFYVSHDSADVWAHPDIFSLDTEGHPAQVAGVPPDYFSADGQLWGMPTFNWEVLAATGFRWWAQRLKRNLRLFDLIRLDHFRAFSTYWEVPAGAATARSGTWKPGPGKAFFDVMQEGLGGLPFVAEDLGDEMEQVYALRDAVGLPGMKVLQFAFGADMARSVDIPHNYNEHCVVYTGTHDNNTTSGWYRAEAGAAGRKRISKYTGRPVREANIHEVLGRLAYASVAGTVILPVQDILGLDAGSRMNTPGTSNGNWMWRLMPGQLSSADSERLRQWTELFNRG